MARITREMLEARAETLNDIMGFKNVGYKGNKTNGAGYIIEGAYGGVRLAFAHKNSSMASSRSGYLSKSELSEFMGAMILGMSDYKNRVKLKK